MPKLVYYLKRIEWRIIISKAGNLITRFVVILKTYIVKKPVFYLMLSFLVPGSLIAQTSLGFRAGMIGTSLVTYENLAYASSNINYNNSFSISCVYEEQISDIFQIGTSLDYDFYKTDITESWANKGGGSGKKEASYRFGYIGLFFYPQFTFGKQVKFVFNIGPFLGLLLNSQGSGIISITNSDGEININNISGNIGSDLVNLPISLKSSIGLFVKINQDWNIIANAGYRFGPCLINSSYAKRQLDLIFSLGFSYSFSNTGDEN